MILSRFFTLLLTATAVLALATTLLATNLLNEQWEHAATDDLIRDRFEIEATLKLDARARMDVIGRVAGNEDVRSALRRASGRRSGEPIDPAIRAALRTKLTELNAQLEGLSGEILFGVDRDGTIVGSIGTATIPEGAGLGQFPLVQRALEGYVRDDVWVYNDGVYRMAARPVIDGGQYVGALVHGIRFDDQLAQLLSERVMGATVGFFHGTSMFAGHMPARAPGCEGCSTPRRDDLGAMLEDVIADENFQRGERTEPRELLGGGRATGVAVYSLVTGSASHANVGYGIARPVRALTGPFAIVQSQFTGSAWASLPWMYLAPLTVLIFLLMMFLLWLEHDRPLSKLRRLTEGLKEAPENRMTITDFGGRYRKVATNVNDALDRSAEGSGVPTAKRRAANLDEILGPTAEGQAAGGGAFFGFASDDQAPVDLPVVPDAKAAATPQRDVPAGAPPPMSPPPMSPPGSPRGLGAPAADPGARPAPPKPPAKPPIPPPRKPEAAAPVAPPLRASGGRTESSSDEATAAGPPSAQQRRMLKSTLLGVAPPKPDDDDDDEDEDDGATMIARVPKELLEQSAGSNAGEEEAHFREVFEKFVATKKQCGEPTTGLTFEKFAVTLRKNQEQIVKRHGASKVRFTVYEKNGKAALKATPIKS